MARSRELTFIVSNVSHAPKYKLEDTMSLKKSAFAFAFALILAAALPLRAQTGCDDSPEDPTIVLALVGGAGALVAGLRTRRRNE
jgi:XrtJ-associated TM-motif-TM protein